MHDSDSHGAFRFLGEGDQFKAYQIDDSVVKIDKRTYSLSTAENLAHVWNNQYNRWAMYLGAYMPPTKYLTAEVPSRPDRGIIYAKQPYIEGKVISEYSQSELSASDLGLLRDFFEASLQMYTAINEFPDIFGMQEAIRRLYRGVGPELVTKALQLIEKADISGSLGTHYGYLKPFFRTQQSNNILLIPQHRPGNERVVLKPLLIDSRPSYVAEHSRLVKDIGALLLKDEVVQP